MQHIREIYDADRTYFSYSGLLHDFKLFGTIYSKDNQIIQPKRYERHVRPGQKLTIEFDDTDLNKIIPEKNEEKISSSGNKFKNIFRRH